MLTEYVSDSQLLTYSSRWQPTKYHGNLSNFAVEITCWLWVVCKALCFEKIKDHVQTKMNQRVAKKVFTFMATTIASSNLYYIYPPPMTKSGVIVVWFFCHNFPCHPTHGAGWSWDGIAMSLSPGVVVDRNVTRHAGSHCHVGLSLVWSCVVWG